MLEAGAKSEGLVTATGLKPRTTTGQFGQMVECSFKS